MSLTHEHWLLGPSRLGEKGRGALLCQLHVRGEWELSPGLASPCRLSFLASRPRQVPSKAG